jgi:hypothetical protein
MFFRMCGKSLGYDQCLHIYALIKCASPAPGFVTAATGIEMKQRKVRIKAEMVITLRTSACNRNHLSYGY